MHGGTRARTVPRFSLVIPAYNEEKRLPDTLSRIARFFEDGPDSYEVLVVANGCSDGTARVAREVARRDPRVRVVEITGRGKGRAVRTGVMEARGRYVGFADADLSWPLEQVIPFVEHLERDGVQVVIGSREGLGARRLDEPYYRHLMGRVFNFVVRMLAVPGIQDTQCGFKWFERGAARAIFTRQTIHGWGFDVELLYIARKLGYAIHEIPITWRHDPNSRVRPVADALHMLGDVLRVRLNDIRGNYGKRLASGTEATAPLD